MVVVVVVWNSGQIVDLNELECRQRHYEDAKVYNQQTRRSRRH
jgi:hypothetical protein